MQQIKFHYFDQRSPEWYKIREGKLTGTKVSSILGKLELAKTKAAIDNAAMKLAIESVHGMIETEYVSFDMQRGVDLEPSAFDLLSSIIAQEFLTLIKVGFVEVSDHVGFSPDGVIEEVNAPCEIKCPTAENFFKMVISDEVNSDWVTQIQHQIRCLNAPYGLFLAYCVHMGKEYYYLKKIERDEKTIALIKEREEIVIDKKKSYIEKLNNAFPVGVNGYIATPTTEGYIAEKIE